jgi:hypothetical protein
MAETFYAEMKRELARSQHDLSRADSDEHSKEFYRELPRFLERAGLQLRRRVDKATVKRFRAFLEDVCRPMPSVTDAELVQALEEAVVAERRK